MDDEESPDQVPVRLIVPEQDMNGATSRPLLVIGAGVAGITAALEAAEAGQQTVLIERSHAIGGRVLGFNRYFPKLCPPSCGLEINVRRLEQNPRIRLITGATVARAVRVADGWSVTIAISPRHVNERCTACGDCARACPGKSVDAITGTELTAIHLPNEYAFPRKFALDRSACAPACTACANACKHNAIDLNAAGREETIEAGAVIVATGWSAYPIANLPELGGGLLADVISNVQMEALAAPAGPTGGKIVRPSDGKAPQRVAFVQCAGSRDINHLPYCSAVCCLASLKQALYVREQFPDAAITMFYIDKRTPGRNEEMLQKAAAAGVRLVKGKVAKIRAGADGSLLMRFEDQETGRLTEAAADLAVLATGMVPNTGGLSTLVSKDSDGFVLDDSAGRVFCAGVARRPEDVAATARDATGAAAKALCAMRGC
jgi:quinone-modifying oxidoreductase, subunit QmoA